MHVLIAGCGWLGSAVAQRLVERGERVTGVRSEPGRAEALRALGVEPLVLDLADPASVSRIPQDVDAIIAMQSAQGEAEMFYRRAYIEANRTLLEVAHRVPSGLARLLLPVPPRTVHCVPVAVKALENTEVSSVGLKPPIVYVPGATPSGLILETVPST